jgi:AcrR family transcriptional regulator
MSAVRCYQVMTCAASAHHAGRASDGVRGPRRRFRTPSPYEQILAATAKVVATEGYEQASVESICALIDIPTERFEEEVESKQQAVLRAVDEFADRVIGDCKLAFEKATSWPDAVWAVSTTFTDWGACEPCFARLGIVEIRGVGESGQRLIGELLETFAMFLDPGYEQFADKGLKKGSLDTQMGERLLALLTEHIQRHSAKTLPRIAPELTHIALAPFIGDAEAQRFVAKRLAEERP